MSFKQQATQSVFWTFLQQFGTQALQFISSVILARLVLPSEFGLIGMLSIITSLSLALIDNGMGSSIMRTLNPDDDDYSTVFYFNVFVSLILYAIIWFISPMVANFFRQPILVSILRLLSVTLIINALAAMHKTRLSKNLNFKIQLFISLPAIIISSTVGILMAYQGYGVWSLVWMMVVNALVDTLFTWLLTGWIPIARFSKLHFKKHFSFGGGR